MTKQTNAYRRAGVVLTSAIALALVTASCSSGKAEPSWASALGPNVSVVAPGQSQSDDSPGGTVLGYVAQVNKGTTVAICGFVEPDVQAACRQDLAGASSSQGPKFSHIELGYVVIHGSEALVGLTGTFCVPGQKPACSTNRDPAALFSAGKSFGTLFTMAEAAQENSGSAYSLSPCIRVTGKWYIDVPKSDI